MFCAVERLGCMGKILFAAILALAGTTVACGDDDASSPAPTPDGGVAAVPVVDAGAPPDSDAGADAGPVTTVSVVAGRPLLEIGAAATKSVIQPVAVGADSAGNVYIADVQNSVVEKVTPAGILSIVAGNGTVGSTKPGPATGTSLGKVSAVRVEPSGNLYIASFSNFQVYKVTPDGTLSIFAGTGVVAGPLSEPTGGAATNASFHYISALAVDSAGDVFIGDRGAFVCKVTPDGSLSVVAGNALPEPDVGPGVATDISLGTVDGLAVDTTGNLFIALGSAHEIAKVTPAGTLSVVAGDGEEGVITDGTDATLSDLGTPSGLALDAAGNLYFADSMNLVVGKVDTSGILTTFAGKGTGGTRDGSVVTPGPANSTYLDQPIDLASDASGNLYIADSGANAVLKVGLATSTLSFAAGGRDIDDIDIEPSPATETTMYDLRGLATDANGNVYFCNNFNLLKVDPAGTVSVIAAAGEIPMATGVAVDAAGDVFIADRDLREILKVTPAGVRTVIAGGDFGAPAPGPATASPLGDMGGLTVDRAGNVYLADSTNAVVEKISPDGTLSIIAGTGTAGAPTPVKATSSPVGNELGTLAVDASGNLYLVDVSNAVVEKIATDGTLSIVAGTGTPSSGGMPKPGSATSTSLTPISLAVDASGDLFLGLSTGSVTAPSGVIAKVTPAGDLTIFAGDGTNGAPTKGVATDVPVGYPVALAVAPNGTLYSVDQAATYAWYVLGVATTTAP